MYGHAENEKKFRTFLYTINKFLPLLFLYNLQPLSSKPFLPMKKTLLSLIVIAFSVHAFALTAISTKKVLGGPFCPGSITMVGYIVDAPASAGNIFTAQLSDQDGNFTAPINIGSVTKTTSGSISCTIPLGLETGKKYRIRVVASNPAIAGSPCQNKVSINPKPNGLSITGITACSATLNWASLSTASAYKVQYRVTGSGSWSSTYDAGSGLSYVFNGLSSATSYDFQVRAVCSNDQKSDWAKKTASTSACGTPTNFIVTDVGLTTSSLDWADAPCTTGYFFQYRAFGEIDWVSLTTTSSNINLTNLFAATLYEAQVANDCGTNNSVWSASIIWETKYFRVAGNADMQAAFKVFPNPSSGAFIVNYSSSSDNEPVEIDVQNMYGQVILHTERQSALGINEAKIDIQNAPSGLYFVSIKCEGNEFKTSMMVK